MRIRRHGESRLQVRLRQRLGQDHGELGASACRLAYRRAAALPFGELFLIAVPFALVALVCVSLIREVPLRTTNDFLPETAEPQPASVGS